MIISFGQSPWRGLGLPLVVAGLLWPAITLADHADWTTYLRVGPGLQYAVIDEVEAQDSITVKRCDKGWCQVIDGGAEGYIAENIVSAKAGPKPPVTHDKPVPCFVSQLSGYGGDEAQRFCGK
jgi:uncharacterized protein YraI